MQDKVHSADGQGVLALKQLQEVCEECGPGFRIVYTRDLCKDNSHLYSNLQANGTRGELKQLSAAATMLPPDCFPPESVAEADPVGTAFLAPASCCSKQQMYQLCVCFKFRFA